MKTFGIVHAGGIGSGLWDLTKHGESKLARTIDGYKVIELSMRPFVYGGIDEYLFTVKEEKLANGRSIAEEMRSIAEELEEKFKIRIVLVVEKGSRGRLGAIQQAFEEGIIPKDVTYVSFNGSDISLLRVKELLEYHKSGKKLGYLITNVLFKRFISEFGECKIEGKTGKILSRTEKPIKKVRRIGLNTGIFVIEPEIMPDMFERIRGYPVTIEDVIPELDSRGLTRAYFIKEFYPIKRNDHIKFARENNIVQKIEQLCPLRI